MDKFFRFIDWLRYPMMVIIVIIFVLIYVSMEGLDKIIEMLGV